MNTDCELGLRSTTTKRSKYRALINVVNNTVWKQGSGTWEDWFWHVIIQFFRWMNDFLDPLYKKVFVLSIEFSLRQKFETLQTISASKGQKFDNLKDFKC